MPSAGTRGVLYLIAGSSAAENEHVRTDGFRILVYVNEYVSELIEILTEYYTVFF
jgi:hypothetical protein